MQKIQIPDRHVTFRDAYAFREQNQEFLNALEIDYFYYLEVDPKNTTVVTMLPECNRAILEAGLAPAYSNLNEGKHYLSHSDTHKSRADFNQWFQSFNMLEFITKKQDTFTLCGFATKEERPETLNHYLTHLAKFESFIQEFSVRGQDLIQSARREPIITTHSSEYLTERSAFPSKFTVKLNSKQSATLSHRELALLQQLCKGLTVKQAAEILILSTRTAESYLNNIKNKLGCNKKSEIIAFCFEQKFPFLLN